MPSNENHEAHDYAERIRKRLPRKLQDAREAAKLSMYSPWQKCGVSRDMISRIEGGESIPTLHVSVRLLSIAFPASKFEPLPIQPIILHPSILSRTFRSRCRTSQLSSTNACPNNSQFAQARP